ncbi:peptide ABC transporter permease [Acrocarpospora pleiomorpha]|uniref:Peptide ABC transporter permease n=1 Tax=Acrocarpospora pleiomorpha TaxID=90975 RepID=A0A5M3XEK0_9ACTN|nr:ABC transporter permease [Acrocarpospora pleiomorpha]GES17353.1 peptide ABC transporter permease [Acrocarpospora pleiomorpha]
MTQTEARKPPAPARAPKSGRFRAQRIGSVLLGYTVTLWLVVTTVFFIGSVLGDPAAAKLGPGATAEQVEALRQQMGFDRPLIAQYGSFLSHLARGDLGVSAQYSTPNLELVMARLPYTFQLAGLALAIAVLVGVPLGAFAGVRKGSWCDRLVTGVTVLMQSVPEFWLGLLGIYIFAVHLELLPVGGAGGADHLIMPAIVLSTYPMGQIARVMRSSVIEVLHESYIESALAHGLPRRTVLLTHCLRNASIPVLSVVGVQVGTLLGSAVTVEVVFGWPGLGSLATQAVLTRDLVLVEAIVVVVAVIFLAVNLLIEILYRIVDPRIGSS